MKTAHLGIKVNIEHLAALKETSKKEDKTVSQILRQLIREFLEKK